MPDRSHPFACALIGATLLIGPCRAADHSVAPTRSAVSPTQAAYRTWAGEQAEMLVRMTRVLARDIAAGDLDAATNDYPMAHRYLARIEAIAGRDLARRMNANAAAFEDGEHDPAFSGFHRIEHDLFAARSTTGLAGIADRLHDDALLLQTRIATQPMPPDVLIDGAVETIAARAAGDIREPYAHTDLWDIEANIEGARAIVAAIRPEVEPRDHLAMARVSARFDEAEQRLAEFREGCGFRGFDGLTRAEKANLSEALRAVAHEVAELKAVRAID